MFSWLEFRTHIYIYTYIYTYSIESLKFVSEFLKGFAQGLADWMHFQSNLDHLNFDCQSDAEKIKS